MSRIERLREYQEMSGPKGESTEANIKSWSQRATDNTETHRAVGKVSTNGKCKADLDPPRVPPTGEVKNRDTALKPERNSKVDARMVAKQDKNFVGDSDYMRGVRRSES